MTFWLHGQFVATMILRAFDTVKKSIKRRTKRRSCWFVAFDHAMGSQRCQIMDSVAMQDTETYTLQKPDSRCSTGRSKRSIVVLFPPVLQSVTPGWLLKQKRRKSVKSQIEKSFTRFTRIYLHFFLNLKVLFH